MLCSHQPVSLSVLGFSSKEITIEHSVPPVRRSNGGFVDSKVTEELGRALLKKNYCTQTHA